VLAASTNTSSTTVLMRCNAAISFFALLHVRCHLLPSCAANTAFMHVCCLQRTAGMLRLLLRGLLLAA
jgi:hypothetical protein